MDQHYQSKSKNQTADHGSGGEGFGFRGRKNWAGCASEAKHPRTKS